LAVGVTPDTSDCPRKKLANVVNSAVINADRNTRMVLAAMIYDRRGVASRVGIIVPDEISEVNVSAAKTAKRNWPSWIPAMAFEVGSNAARNEGGRCGHIDRTDRAATTARARVSSNDSNSRI
jgi:hypothetical protein